MKNSIIVLLLFMIIFGSACHDKDTNDKVAAQKHHLNIPANGIESLMESNTSKIIEGTEGSIVITMGEITRKKADITIRRNDRILEEQLVAENEQLTFDYEGSTYTILVKTIKKPLIGAGKAEISVNLK
jgi:hypothetical protein